VRFQYPFWWNNLVSALDSISLIGLSKDDEDVQNALNWLIENQEESGLWRLSYSEIHKAVENQRTREMQLWVSLAICRIFKRLYEGDSDGLEG
jgi:membrane-anchored protein YejM (alkaline phosphatase superfamily)